VVGELGRGIGRWAACWLFWAPWRRILTKGYSARHRATLPSRHPGPRNRVPNGDWQRGGDRFHGSGGRCQFGAHRDWPVGPRLFLTELVVRFNYGARRRTELGLPLLLAAGRHLHAHGVYESWIFRRSTGVARLADARQRGGRKSCEKRCRAQGALALGQFFSFQRRHGRALRRGCRIRWR
jgi:hypothetical protein